jgi:glycerol-3-phosphate acyltransferase PlsX
MDDKPVVALRKKKDSSIARAAELVSDGEADALVSLGNTGGIFAAATFKVGRIDGVDRGCIATVIPRQGNEFVLLDAGANMSSASPSTSPNLPSWAASIPAKCLAAKTRASAF